MNTNTIHTCHAQTVQIIPVFYMIQTDYSLALCNSMLILYEWEKRYCVNLESLFDSRQLPVFGRVAERVIEDKLNGR
jgi:hypothetical protein